VPFVHRSERQEAAEDVAPHPVALACGEVDDSLLPTVEELLTRLGASLGDHEPEELPHNRWLSPAVWRVRTGQGQMAVLKYFRSDRSRGATPWDAHWTAQDHDPHRWNFWAREPLAYRDHLTAVYAEAGIQAPVSLGCQIDDQEASLLLEWVDGQPGESWALGSYGAAAEALGRAQAPFLNGRPLPEVPWMSQRFLRQYSAEKPVNWQLLDDTEAWRHPLAADTFPPGLQEAVVFVHANRERLYCISESLPRTLCHLDFWPKNLFCRPNGEIALIDWSFAGFGSIGEDIGNLVLDASFDHFIPAEELGHLAQVIFDGYLRGLRSAGWKEDPRLVQLGMWSSSVKYDWLAPFTLAQLRHERQYRYGGGGEIDATFRFRERSRTLLFSAGWARLALELAAELGL
jgi:hypothetical protein